MSLGFHYLYHFALRIGGQGVITVGIPILVRLERFGPDCPGLQVIEIEMGKEYPEHSV